MCLARIRATGGAAVAVADDAIVAAIARLARLTGVFAEPAAAASLAGLEAALAAGLVERSERVVLLVTGSGLKDIPAAARAIEMPQPVAPEIGEVEALIGSLW
jgi:threonine synthase